MPWLARDKGKFGDLCIFEYKPVRCNSMWCKSKGTNFVISTNFDKGFLKKHIKWEDEPIEIEIKIK